ncbi:MAG: IS66 family insertion sequence element accessory protein TnpB [Desulfofustis sp. PB-SRB1]|jgi:transposase|nr:IS66 family insertion sequence element accessory protein TnpB [Desulfofustis sp. PB-SRB1]
MVGVNKVYLALGATDMRKSFNGLSLLVAEQFELDLFSEQLFAFCNRRRTMVKLLWWDGTGFCIWFKRLEKDRFRWPEDEQEVMAISPAALGWLLQGLDLSQAHQRLDYDLVA